MKTKSFLLLTSFLLIFMMACKSDKDYKQEITDRLNTIYTDAFAYFDAEEESEKDLYELYCTKEFKDLWHKVEKEEEATGYLCLDYDIWTNAQDIDNPKMRIESIELLDDTHATANVVINDFGEDTSNQLFLIKEKNEWRIDDFVRDDYSVKKTMEAFLNDE